MIVFILGLIHTFIYTIAAGVAKIFFVIAYGIIAVALFVVCFCLILLIIETILDKIDDGRHFD